MTLIFFIFFGLILIVISLLMLFLRQTLLKTMASAQTQNRQHLQDIHHQQLQQMQKMQFELQQRLLDKLNEQQKNMVEQQLKSVEIIQTQLSQGRHEQAQRLSEATTAQTKHLSTSIDKLTDMVHLRLKEITGQVEKRLSDGFEKTTQIFSDIVKRLALIDEAQKKITELSSNVVSLQSILNDKRSRGAMGEVQLSALIRNVLPENTYDFQHTLSNGKRADCMLYLPDPTGNIAIDAKFPLESYQQLMDLPPNDPRHKAITQQFRKDIKKHIDDIASKYIIRPETAEGAIMFIPAEAVFAEIHAHFRDLVEYSFNQHVWLASPTTMMAILSTTRAVIKDDATRQQVDIIQQHLLGLGQDFNRFQKRMDNLERHIHQANEDVKSVNISARKITSKFNRIEQVQLNDQNTSHVTSEIPMLDTEDN